MNELQAQSLVIQSVRNAGGAANKLSNRFMIGVADLLVKLPVYPALLVEVKLQRVGRTTKDAHQFELDVTVPQRKFLLDYHKAGMHTCVLSFVERGGLGRCGLYAAQFSLDTLEARRYYVVTVSEHVVVPLAAAGEATLTTLLRRAIDG